MTQSENLWICKTQRSFILTQLKLKKSMLKGSNLAKNLKQKISILQKKSTRRHKVPDILNSKRTSLRLTPIHYLTWHLNKAKTHIERRSILFDVIDWKWNENQHYEAVSFDKSPLQKVKTKEISWKGLLIK